MSHQRPVPVRDERSSNGSAPPSTAARPPLYSPSPSYHQQHTPSTQLLRGRSTSPQLAEMSSAMDNSSCPPSPVPHSSSSTSSSSTSSSSSSPAFPPSHPTPPSPRSLSRPRSRSPLLDSDPHPQRRGDDRPARVIRLYYSMEFQAVAQEVARLSEGRVELCEIEWKRFPDGFPNLRIDKSNEMKAHTTHTHLHPPLPLTPATQPSHPAHARPCCAVVPCWFPCLLPLS